MKILTLTPRKPIMKYPSGIISLALLPVFCLTYMNKHRVFVPANKIDIATWSPDVNKNPSKKTFEDFLPKRNYFRINLDGQSDADDKTRLDFAKLQIREMLKGKSITDGVDFHFGNNAKYWTFITAIDICQVENVPAFVPYNDDLYALYVKSPKLAKNVFRCGTIDNDVVFKLIDNTSSVEFAELVKSFWAPGLVFLAMLFFTLRKTYLNKML